MSPARREIFERIIRTGAAGALPSHLRYVPNSNNWKLIAHPRPLSL